MTRKMSISIDSIYCKHWMVNDKVSLPNNNYPCFDIHPHKVLHIKDSIHYHALKTEDYSMYSTLVSETKQHEHSVDEYKNLLQDFDLERMEKIKVTFTFGIKKYVITDGVHRMCILLYRNLINSSISLKLLDISYDGETINHVYNNLLSTTKTLHYNGWNNRLPYQSINLGNVEIQGQRNSRLRIQRLRRWIDFTDKKVVDFGCNIGGNLMQIPEICCGIGFDYDKKCISVARDLESIYQYDRGVTFWVHDFDKDSYEDLHHKIGKDIDIIFLTSMGSWVKTWPTLYQLCKDTKADIILETNNDDEGRPQLEFFQDYNTKLVVEQSDDDCTGNLRRKTYILTPKKICKVHVPAKYHHKNEHSLNFSIDFLGWQKSSFEDADLVLSSNVYYDIENYPEKRFVFGPHFSVFPNDEVKRFNNKYNNAIYIQPSQQSINSWTQEFGFTNLPMYTYPFGVDTHKFNPQEQERDIVFIYYKNRDPSELSIVKDFLNQKGIQYQTFMYGSYKEENYINLLQQAKYGIWLGTHESQGYALEEALSMNVPLLVWNVTLRKQEWSMRTFYEGVKSRVTSIPYWDERCGEFFYTSEQLSFAFDKFISKLSTYRPREFIMENLTMEKRAFALRDLVKKNLSKDF